MGTLNPATSDRPLSIQVERMEGVALVTLGGACTMEVSRQIWHSLVGLVTEQVPAVIVDMTDLDFVDSVGLGGLVAAHLKMRHHHGTVALVSPQPPIMNVLEITRLTQLFPIFPTVRAALENVRPNEPPQPTAQRPRASG